MQVIFIMPDMVNAMIKSPISYIGNKYKLLSQILPLFPSNIDTFYDIFCGGLDISINVEAQYVYANDICTPLIDTYKDLQLKELWKVERTISNAIEWFNLDKTNVDGFNEMRAMYNKTQDVNACLLLVLAMYSFNHMIRFSKIGNFNTSFGWKTAGYNSKMKESMPQFIERIKNIEFTSKDFKEFGSEAFLKSLKKDDFVYCLPEGSLIYQNGQYAKIEDVVENVTNLGNGNICTKKHVRETVEEEIIELNIMGVSKHNNLKLSKNHIVFTYDKEKNIVIEKKAEELTTSDLLLIDYEKDIKNYIPNYSLYSKNSHKILDFSSFNIIDFGTLLGLYMAEGHMQNGLIFSFNQNEHVLHELTSDLVKKMFGIDAQICKNSPHKSVTQVRVHSNEIMNYMLEFYNGETARFKKMSDFVMKWNPEIQLNILRGWLFGDGGLYEVEELNENPKFKRSGNRNKLKLTGSSASIELATQMYNIALRCGLHPCIKERISSKNILRKDGRTQTIVYDVYFTCKVDIEKIQNRIIVGRDCKRRFHIEENMITRINSISKIKYSGKMYDLTTTQGNFWTYGNVKVHNCDPPYLMTNAQYNENDGWNVEDEQAMYDFCDAMNIFGIKWAMSNILSDGAKENTMLKEWSKKYTIHYLDKDYSNSNYQKKDKSAGKTVEVLICNYIKEV